MDKIEPEKKFKQKERCTFDIFRRNIKMHEILFLQHMVEYTFTIKQRNRGVTVKKDIECDICLSYASV